MSHPSIIVLSIPSQEPMHDSTNRTCLAFNQQMHMVGHETVCVKEEWQLGLLNSKEREKLLVIRWRVKYLPSIIAPRDYVIQTTFDFSARSTSHGTRMLLLSNSGVKAPRRKDFASPAVAL